MKGFRDHSLLTPFPPGVTGVLLGPSPSLPPVSLAAGGAPKRAALGGTEPAAERGSGSEIARGSQATRPGRSGADVDFGPGPRGGPEGPEGGRGEGQPEDWAVTDRTDWASLEEPQ